jgi:hypothetical protein
MLCTGSALARRAGGAPLKKTVEKVVTDSAALAVHRGRFHKPPPFASQQREGVGLRLRECGVCGGHLSLHTRYEPVRKAGYVLQVR